MTSSRIDEALEAKRADGLMSGRVLALRPRAAGSDLSALAARDRTQIVTGFRPDHDRLDDAGLGQRPRHLRAAFDVPRWCSCPAPVPSSAPWSIRRRTLVPAGAPILIDGQKNDGIESALKDIRARTRDHHGVLSPNPTGAALPFIIPGPTAFDGWQAAPHQAAPGFTTLPGVFSADGPDPGSACSSPAICRAR